MPALGVGDYAAHIRHGGELLNQLRREYDALDLPACQSTISRLAMVVIYFPTYLDPAAPSPTQAEEVVLAREYLELAVLTAVRAKELDDFERRFEQLRVYYDTPCPRVAPSERRLLMLGLNLLRLLVCSRVAAFHSELERIPVSPSSNVFLRFALKMERLLMEGSYNQVLHARKNAPSNDFVPLVEMLESTVRHEVGRCMPKVYASLGLEGARALLMVKSNAELDAVANREGWAKNASGTRFVFRPEVEGGKHVVPFHDALKMHVECAIELQRVV